MIPEKMVRGIYAVYLSCASTIPVIENSHYHSRETGEGPEHPNVKRNAVAG